MSKSVVGEINFTKLNVDDTQASNIFLRPISNQGLLTVTTVLFVLFVIAEFIGGYAGMLPLNIAFLI
jgi:hypothetical protein